MPELLRDLDDREAALVDQERGERVAEVVGADALDATGPRAQVKTRRRQFFQSWSRHELASEPGKTNSVVARAGPAHPELGEVLLERLQ